MLTSDLLATRTYKGKIEPVYAAPDQENLEIADSVINLFRKHIGKTYGELVEEIEGIEEINYRLIRGLSQILERRCVIGMDSIIEPANARRIVFEECKGAVTDIKERKEVLYRAAEKLSVEPPVLEKALWADQEENLIIKEFRNMAPESLLRQYNLSLTQTLLFKATGMEIKIEDNYQQVFRKIKQLGLMYSIRDDRIYLDGPVSLFKMTERYGTALAKLLPAIMKGSKWGLKASILKKTMQGKRIYDFALDNSMRIFSIDTDAIFETFDSAIEKEFSLLSFNGWLVMREPAVLKAGQYAFIPDFSLERSGNRIYVEIVGFWTPEYLRNKIQKINQLKENMIIIVDRNLACSGSEFKTDNLIFYDRKIPYLEILRILRRYEEKQTAKEVGKLKYTEIVLEGSVVSLRETAEKYNVSVDSMKAVVKQKDGYMLIGDQLISGQTLEAVGRELNGVKKHGEALEIFGKYGIKSQQMLDVLGYKVKWKGLDSENAEIVKI